MLSGRHSAAGKFFLMSTNVVNEPARSLPIPESTGGAAAIGRAVTAPAMRPVTLLQPGRIFFGNGSAADFVAHLSQRGLKSVFIVTSSAVLDSCRGVFAAIEAAGIKARICSAIDAEPSVRMFEECLAAEH